MHIPHRFIPAESHDCMEGTPPMSSYEDETGVKLIIIIIIIIVNISFGLKNTNYNRSVQIWNIIQIV